MSSLKRKHVNITIQQKLDILRELEKGKSAKQLAYEYNIGCSTVHDIKKNKNKLLNYSLLVSESICGSENRKTMKKSPYEVLDKALIHWFNNERAQGKAITGPMCAKQAKHLFNTIGLQGNFDASSGWLARFKDRYGIRSVGNSLDCIWTIGVVEPNIFEGETPVLENNEEEAQIEYETIEMGCENGDISYDDFSSVQQHTVKGLGNSKEHSISGKVTTNCPITEDISNCKNKYESEKSLQTESGSQSLCGTRTIDYEIKNLKYIVEKLDIVTNKLSDLGDSYDHFGRYVSLLLKGLPPQKVLYLKQKIVSDVLQSVLAYEKGISEESLSYCTPEFDTNKSKTKTSASNKKLFNSFSKVSANNSTNLCKGVSNISRLSRKRTHKANTNTKMSGNTSQNISYFTLPSSLDNLIPDSRLQDSSVNLNCITDQSHFIVQRSVSNTESAENVSDSSLTYFPVASVDVSQQPLEIVNSDCTKRHLQSIGHLFTTSKSNQEASTAKYGLNGAKVTLMEPIELKKEKEMDDITTWDTSVTVKVEVPCQNEDLDEILPDCRPIELIDCGLCPTQCASKNVLVHHFLRSHPGCVPISKMNSHAELNSESS